MLTLFERLTSNQVFDFHGGIHPPEHKSLSNHRPIGRLKPAPELVVPLRQHLGELGELLVKAGDTVLKGQPLSRPLSVMGVPVHAPTSGTVLAVENRPLTHPSGLWDMAVVIEPDGQNQWADKHPVADPFEADPAVLLKALKSAGLAGMGGAGFPTTVKLASGRPIDALVINAAECEPYITSDDCLLREEADSVIGGARLMARIVGAKLVVIGIEDNKPEAISAIEAVIESLDDVTMKVVPTKYPSGAERQLIKLLTGTEVPAGGIPADLGLVVQNVGTAFAAYRALVHGEPLIKRVVTITGQQVKKPGNYWLPIGTPISHALAECGFEADKRQRFIVGGPMMGFTLNDTAAPVTKTVNCLLLPNKKELPLPGREMNCIRCGECANVCPADLLPQQLYWYAKAKDQEKLDEYKLSACIECGACAFVCPSQIPLVQYYRVAKAESRAAAEEKRKSDKARERFEARKDRLERDKAEREARHQEATERRKAAMAARSSDQPKDNDAVAAALARVKAQKDAAVAKAQEAAEQGAHLDKGERVPDNSEMAKLREERKRQAREKKAQQEAQLEPRQEAQLEAQKEDQPDTPTPSPAQADKASAVAAAIARAKAKKAEAAGVAAADSEQAADPKKAAVAAAVARAKAKKAEATGAEASAQPQAEAGEDDAAARKKAAVAAAVARAKAKKADATGEEASAQPQAETAEDDAAARKKAAVAAAVARAKAKKAEAAGEEASPQPQAESAEDDAAARKKAAVAAAVARAKDKKAEAAGEEASPQPQAEPPEDDAAARKKAAVAAAVARAKAKKQAQEGQD
ncbi:electron transport complex subunit RsxC [Gallaecimonas xiamenensis]|uniref:Ion-translocating oxidoreductase complex subunit C n=1 Tax=Gallaecimonas xiamenensis 3-C-1 TaxID=745411 RepID=K2JEZ5_9GAMM|nr:electron transport complex subunit RsxC [Gallaecimonas xiamenensis]EKE69159.1 electron transport complex protein RnfC [Gallaecimonas xiamenensis 3-C-1]